MLINKIKSMVNIIIDTAEYCLYGLFRLIIAPIRIVSIYKDNMAMKQYHEDMGYVKTHKHDNYQSQIDSVLRTIGQLSAKILKVEDNLTNRMDGLAEINKSIRKELRELKAPKIKAIKDDSKIIFHIPDELSQVDLAQIEAELKGESVVKELYDYSRESRLIKEKIKAND